MLNNVIISYKHVHHLIKYMLKMLAELTSYFTPFDTILLTINNVNSFIYFDILFCDISIMRKLFSGDQMYFWLEELSDIIEIWLK